jgi:hypothetical protein
MAFCAFLSILPGMLGFDSAQGRMRQVQATHQQLACPITQQTDYCPFIHIRRNYGGFELKARMALSSKPSSSAPVWAT